MACAGQLQLGAPAQSLACQWRADRQALRSGVMTVRALLLATAIGCTLFVNAQAATAAAKHPDLSGFWSPSVKVPRDKALLAKLPPNTALLEDLGPVEFPAGEYGGLKPKAAALEAA